MFLDEVGDLPAVMQSKILRVLQDKEVRRIGSRENIKVDVRVISATNRDLEKEITKKNFREDLYYRLKVITIELPPLRERRGDIPELVDFFIRKYNQEFGKRIKGVEGNTMKALTEYHWPGNIRQLESVIERAVLMCESDKVSLLDIKGELRLFQQQDILNIDIPDEGISIEELEKHLILRAMEKSGWVITKAAKLLGLSFRTLQYRLEKFNINKETTPKSVS